MRQMARSRWAALTGVAVVGALALSACSSSTSSSSGKSEKVAVLLCGANPAPDPMP